MARAAAPAARAGATRSRRRRRPADDEVYRRSDIEAKLQCLVFEGDESGDAAFGTVFHDAMKLMLQHLRAVGLESDWDAIPRITRQAFFGRANGLHPDRLEEVEALLSHVAHTRLADLRTLMTLEDRIVVATGLHNPVTGARMLVSGQPDRLDRVDGGDPDDDPSEVRVTDYKTWRAVTDNTFQGRFYACLVFAKYPSVEWVTTAFDYVRPAVRGANGDGSAFELTYERGELDGWWQGMLKGFAERLGQPRKPTGCRACQYCRLRSSCGGSLAPYRDMPEGVDAAEVLFREWVRAEQAAKSRKGALAAWFEQTGRDPESWGGFRVGWMEPEKPQWKVTDPLGVVKGMEAAGLNGKAALVTWIDPKAVPYHVKPALVTLGVAKYVYSEAEFKRRVDKGPGRNRSERELVNQLLANDADSGEGDDDEHA